jgi:hypothetical protein
MDVCSFGFRFLTLLLLEPSLESRNVSVRARVCIDEVDCVRVPPSWHGPAVGEREGQRDEPSSANAINLLPRLLTAHVRGCVQSSTRRGTPATTTREEAGTKTPHPRGWCPSCCGPRIRRAVSERTSMEVGLTRNLGIKRRNPRRRNHG